MGCRLVWVAVGGGAFRILRRTSFDSRVSQSLRWSEFRSSLIWWLGVCGCGFFG